MARYDDLNTKMIGFAAVLSALLLIVIIVGVQALSYYWENAQAAIKEQGKYESSLQILDQQRKSMDHFAWVTVPPPEPEKGQPPAAPTKRLQLPIQKAMELTIKNKASAPDKTGT